MRNDLNDVRLTGTLLEDARYSHEAFGEPVYRARMSVRRTSGAEDTLVLQMGMHTAGRRVDMLKAGDRMQLSGQLRSYVLPAGAMTKTEMVVHVQVIGPWAGEDENQVCITGMLMRAPVFRVTQLGWEVCDMVVRVAMRGRWANVPVIAFGGTARWASMLECGERVRLQGRLQSRVYTGRSHTGLQVSVMTWEVAVAKMALEDAPE